MEVLQFIYDFFDTITDFMSNSLKVLYAFIKFVFYDFPSILIDIIEYMPSPFIVIITGTISLFVAFIILKLIKMLPTF